jgi:DNA polymerase-3 subunit alpha
MKVLHINNDGMEAAAADRLWNDTEGFASYSFNKSHSVAYSLITYQSAYLKKHYPIEFYAACLSTVGEDKLSAILLDAAKSGIEVLPPDINISTNEFVIGNDTTLYMPFNRMKGLSDKGGNEIIKARALKSYTVTEKIGRGKTATEETKTISVTPGRFASVEDFEARVNKTLVNSKVRENLDKVGAFARIVPGSRASTDIMRIKDQLTLLPGLISGVVTADREIPNDKFTKARILAMSEELATAFPGVEHAAPGYGVKPRFMVVSDCPGRSEEFARQFTKGDAFQYVAGALVAAGMKTSIAYWTGLVKKRKEGKVLSPSEIANYQPYFERELELLKPPLILTLGNAATRYFLPELKGDMQEHVGRTFWSEKHDAMILVGFNPAMIHFDPDKHGMLAELFVIARSIVLPDEK